MSELNLLFSIYVVNVLATLNIVNSDFKCEKFLNSNEIVNLFEKYVDQHNSTYGVDVRKGFLFTACIGCVFLTATLARTRHVYSQIAQKKTMSVKALQGLPKNVFRRISPAMLRCELGYNRRIDNNQIAPIIGIGLVSFDAHYYADLLRRFARKCQPWSGFKMPNLRPGTQQIPEYVHKGAMRTINVLPVPKAENQKLWEYLPTMLKKRLIN